jgi:hypothetical protein
VWGKGAVVKEAKYWTCNESDEVLTAESVDDAIQYFVDEVEVVPRKLKVYGFAQIEIPPNAKDRIGKYVLENIIEILDDDWGNPEDGSEITEEMRTASQDFAGKILDLYHVWRCEKVEEVEVDMVAWCTENEPELLKIIESAPPLGA